ncbi:MAG: VOC family protein [Spirochaetales bacterium]|nr:VOC family protein [Spirochaetales bacterium]
MPSWKIGQVCHTELNTTDLSGAENFYKKLFGWKITAMDVPGFGKYLMIGTGKDSFGGIGPQPDPDAPPGWLTYFYVKSVDAAAKQAESMGGKIMMPATDIGPGMGRIAVVSDPQGAVFGLYTM